MLSSIKNIPLQPIKSLSTNNITTNLLRLDQLHPIVSGNKWFKLRYYLEEALLQQKSTIASFGGAYSNHIVALAFACKQQKLQAVGIIRGEESPNLSDTLKEATSYGMQLIYVSRSDFKDKKMIQQKMSDSAWYWINEGGYGINGALGAATILDTIDSSTYTDICCAVGTGTMIAGLIKKSSNNQLVTGISALKNNFSITAEINELLSKDEQNKRYNIQHQFHFGGYAKHSNELIDFMNILWEKENIPTDIVYTGKLLFGVSMLLQTGYFSEGAKVLVIHSGGLQGNRSLTNGLLQF